MERCSMVSLSFYLKIPPFPPKQRDQTEPWQEGGQGYGNRTTRNSHNLEAMKDTEFNATQTLRLSSGAEKGPSMS